MKITRWFHALFRRERLDAEMRDELQAHLDLQAVENERRGMSAQEARYAARRAFGGVEQVKERARDVRGWAWVEDLGRDLKFGFRMLAKTPVMAVVIVLSLAVGLGANTAVFSWIRTVALSPLPGVRDGRTLVIVEQQGAAGLLQFASVAEWRDLRTQTTSFTDLMVHSFATFNLAMPTQDLRVWGGQVSGNFFEVLGVRPAAGRLLRPEDDEPGRPPVVVISHKLWQEQYNGRADIVGETMRLNSRTPTIVGVAPEGFQGAVTALAFDVWVPTVGLANPEDRKARFFQLVGRLRDGVSREQATTDVSLVLQRLAEQYPDTNRGLTAEVIPYWRSKVGAQALIVPTLATLQAVMVLVLLIVCTNTANLLLAHAATRGKEIAIRLAIGASRVRVVRQLLAESLLLALLGAGLGTVLAFWGLDLINGVPKPTGLPIALVAQLDRGELAFSVALAIACALAFGLLPALRMTKPDLGHALKAGGRTSGGGGRRRFQEFLVGVEIALTLVIVIMAGLFVKSFQHAKLLNPGFEPAGVLLGSYDLASRGYSPERARVFTASLLARVRELPGVEAAAVATAVPLDLLRLRAGDFLLEGRSHADSANDQTLWHSASRGFFDALRLPLAEGQDFSAVTEKPGEPEAVVNTEFVRRYLAAGQPALGRRLTMNGTDYRIVGVVRTAKYNTLSETPQPMAYLSYGGQARTRLTLFVRSTADAATAYAGIKQAVRELDAGVSLLETRSLAQHLDDGMVMRVIPAKVLAVLGPLALLLAVTGLYSVLAYSVAQRTHEIGVRMTLGASARTVVAMIMRQGMTAVVAGVVVGLVAAYFVSVRLATQLVEVPAGDIALFTAIPAVLTVVALLACYLPARRAAKVEPMVALRCE